MDLSKRWLQDYVDLEVDDHDFAEAITLSGSKVESYRKEGDFLSHVVVGRIEEIVHHPNADTLWICRVNVGK
ncbi:MAG TPA: hypothetical protein PLS28_02600, partial [Clostridiales bacterium]|nr:hypothetical protein [Clostridiales bacterium]